VIGNLVEDDLDVQIAFAAGRALTAALLGEEFLVHAQKIDDACAFVDDQQAARADHDAGSTQVVIGIGRIENRGVGNLARGTTELDQLDLAIVLYAASKIVDDFADGRAEGNLEDAGIIDIAGNRNHLGANRFARATGSIDAVLIHQEMRDNREAFDVIEAGRAGKQAADLNEGRFHAWAASLALDGADQRRAFAADIGTAARVEVQVEIEVLAENIIAEEPVVLGLTDGIQEQRAQAGVLCSHIDIAIGRAADEACDDQRFDEVERIVLDQGAVLEGRCLALVGIADDDFVLAAHGAGLMPFAAERVLSTATAAYLGVRKHLTDFLGVHIHGLAQRFKAANLHIRANG